MTIIFPNFARKLGPDQELIGQTADQTRRSLHTQRINFLESLHRYSGGLEQEWCSVSHGDRKPLLKPQQRDDLMTLYRSYGSMLANFGSSVQAAYGFLDTLVDLVNRSTEFNVDQNFDRAKHEELFRQSRLILGSALRQLTQLVNNKVLPLVKSSTGFNLEDSTRNDHAVDYRSQVPNVTIVA